MGKEISAHFNGALPSHTEIETVPPPTDIELITRVQADSGGTDRQIGRSAFAELVRRHSPALLRYLGNLLPRRDLAEDAAQEVFLAAWCHRARFDSRRGSFAAWLFTIARNRAHNLRRKVTIPPLPINGPPPGSQPPVQPGPDRDLALKEAYAALDRALAELPFEQRSVFILAEVQGLSMAEIAAVENLSPGTVKSRLSRARKKIKHRFNGLGDLLDE
jgi:RNA polymerase sigma-70 factor, ECF subfamily